MWDFHSETSDVCRSCLTKANKEASRKADPVRHLIWKINAWSRARLSRDGFERVSLPTDDLIAIYTAAKGICTYCGLRFDDLQLEHCVPLSRGGTHSINNLVWACQHCNCSKNDKTPAEYAAYLTARNS